ncbi:unnamed protein product [Darwinula stevensoni]|uniref:Uncharacterized protein n=1 Tax=Darwinula stevensoni TaxID=69355 RepID=A0A7R9AHE4_9CRUS|nr:unnamed protein product [Darwinula stevensoni]CAG0904317.1 unnamed protein product [Darwinula stevensoni]
MPDPQWLGLGLGFALGVIVRRHWFRESSRGGNPLIHRDGCLVHLLDALDRLRGARAGVREGTLQKMREEACERQRLRAKLDRVKWLEIQLVKLKRAGRRHEESPSVCVKQLRSRLAEARDAFRLLSAALRDSTVFPDFPYHYLEELMQMEEDCLAEYEQSMNEEQPRGEKGR